MPPLVDISFQRFGRLLALKRVENSAQGKTQWLCRCDCGNDKIQSSDLLRSGKSKSCGCFRRDFAAKQFATHGMSDTPEFRVWAGMLNRCLNPNEPFHRHYGQRGITVCDRWRNSFEDFYADIGPRPSADHSIERLNNNGNYEPSNCVWATTKQQTRNYRRNRLVTVGGETVPLVVAVETRGLNYKKVHGRLKSGWSIERALEIENG